MSKSNKRGHRDSGFSLLEVIIAMVVLVIGLVGVSLTMTKTLSSSVESKYMSIAGTLASEKLEDIDRWDYRDPHVAVPVGSTTAGSLVADVAQNVTSNGGTEYIAYYDQVAMTVSGQVQTAPGSGAFVEVVAGTGVGGASTYDITTHSANGLIQSVSSTTNPAVSYTFERRWLIEVNPTINGTLVNNVRRITVLVRSIDPSIQPPVNFQMSMVRP
ncbi:MAG: prepilin-type N-terminal cleavage/methylation domain-containing protein [Candidatus Acidiferrales bacterium]